MIAAAKRKQPLLKIHKPTSTRRERKMSPYHHPFLRALGRRKGGLTDEELAILTGSSPSHARGRRKELVEFGMAESSGTTRKTGSGWSATVWRITKSGAEQIGKLRRAKRV